MSIDEYKQSGKEFALAVDAWSRDFNYLDYVSMCQHHSVTPLAWKEYLDVCKDCDVEMAIDLGLEQPEDRDLTARKDPITALTHFPHLLTPERLRDCALRAPKAALMKAAHLLPEPVIKECKQLLGVEQ